MSDFLTHHCGLALIRLRMPLDHYAREYGDAGWGLKRLYLLMEKQRNRGQDGAGIGVVKFDMPMGDRYLMRARSANRNPINTVFESALKGMERLERKIKLGKFSPIKAKQQVDFLGELCFGHLRYGTHSGHSKTNCHPFLRRNNVPSRSLALAGNFNMTNSPALFEKLVEYGLHPVGESDTQVILEKISFALDVEHDHLRATMGPGSFRNLEGKELAEAISNEMDPARVLHRATREWDGGYVFAGLIGNGDAFICRDPAGIRPAFYYLDDEVVAMASERAALVTTFGVSPDKVKEITPAHALIIKRNGDIREDRFTESLPLRQCTFERVYFSRGNDRDIYRERKQLGRNLAPRVLEALGGSLEHAVFSFIPNTAEAAFVGLTEALGEISRSRAAKELWRRVEAGNLTREQIDKLMNGHPRIEKAAHKDQKLRTFITRDDGRHELVSHVYDITPEVVGPDETLVVLDDSIVRGTTLRDSIITMLSRLNPARIIIVSSSPPIKYPDCYGIDMSQLGRFIAFEAAVTLLRERGECNLLAEVERKCRAQADLPADRIRNYVAEIYKPFSLEELSAKISQLVRSDRLTWQGRLEVIYQSVEGLRAAMPGYSGDWYFTGDYPTPGGYKVLNTAFMNWQQHDDSRSY